MPSEGRPELVVGVDVRCLRAGLDRLAGVGVHARELIGRLLGPSPPEGPSLRVLPFAGSRWGSGAGEALSGFAGAPGTVTTWIPGRALEAVWRRCGWPPLETVTGPFDLLHGPDYFLPPHRCARRIYTVHDLTVLRRPEFSSDRFRRYFERELPSWRRDGTRFIAVSEFTRQEMVELLGIPAERVRVIHNGVGREFRPPATPRDRADVAEFLTANDLPTRFLLGVGSLQPRKNLLGLIQAMLILRERKERKEPLVLCGNEEWLSSAIRTEAKRLGDSVRFITLTRAQMPLLYSAAAALIYPSFYEGFGLPPLEAMACGTPVGVSRAGAHAEVVGEAGLYFEPNDIEAIAACMERLLEDTPLRAQLQRAGPARAARFTWERAAAETRAAYRAAQEDRFEELEDVPLQISSESEMYLVSR